MTEHHARAVDLAFGKGEAVRTTFRPAEEVPELDYRRPLVRRLHILYHCVVFIQNSDVLLHIAVGDLDTRLERLYMRTDVILTLDLEGVLIKTPVSGDEGL